jgi:hypothetical protein
MLVQMQDLSLSNIANINQIIVDNVQGDFVVGEGKTIQFVNSLGITTNSKWWYRY